MFYPPRRGKRRHRLYGALTTKAVPSDVNENPAQDRKIVVRCGHVVKIVYTPYLSPIL